MGIIVKGKKGEYTPAPEGLHHSVCCDVIDLGVCDTQFGRKRQIEIRWQTSEKMPGGKPYLVIKKYGASMHKKANLRRDIESWRGKGLTEEEADAFDVEKVLGVCCQLNIQHVPFADGGVFAKVSAIVPAPRGSAAIKVQDYQRVQDRPGYVAPDPNDLEGDLVEDHGPIPDDVNGVAPAEEDIPF